MGERFPRVRVRVRVRARVRVMIRVRVTPRPLRRLPCSASMEGEMCVRVCVDSWLHLT